MNRPVSRVLENDTPIRNVLQHGSENFLSGAPEGAGAGDEDEEGRPEGGDQEERTLRLLFRCRRRKRLLERRGGSPARDFGKGNGFRFFRRNDGERLVPVEGDQEIDAGILLLHFARARPGQERPGFLDCAGGQRVVPEGAEGAAPTEDREDDRPLDLPVAREQHLEERLLGRVAPRESDRRERDLDRNLRKERRVIGSVVGDLERLLELSKLRLEKRRGGFVFFLFAR